MEITESDATPLPFAGIGKTEQRDNHNKMIDASLYENSDRHYNLIVNCLIESVRYTE